MLVMEPTMELTDQELWSQIREDYSVTDQIRLLYLLANHYARPDICDQLREIERIWSKIPLTDQVIALVARAYSCTPRDIQGSGRSFRLARFCAASLMYAHRLCHMTLAQIQHALRPSTPLDHTTVLYYINQAEADERYYEAAYAVAHLLGVDYAIIERLPQRATRRVA